MAGRPSIKRPRAVPVVPPNTAALEALKHAAVDFGRAGAQGMAEWHRASSALMLAAKLYAKSRST